MEAPWSFARLALAVATMKRILALLLFFACCVAGSAAATQYLARTFRYHAALGAPLAHVATVPVYSPIEWYRWKQQWGKRAPREFLTALGIALSGLFLGVGVLRVLVGDTSTPKPVGAYGTARWATPRELGKAKLLGNRGVILCQTAEAELVQSQRGWQTRALGQLLRHDGQEHTILFAPTGGGKGVGMVLPTLLSWLSSVVVYDTKRENWELTAGWRRLFSHVLRFEPTARHSVRFNPLLEIRPYPYDVGDAQAVASILVNPEGMSAAQRDYWSTAGHAFLVGVILHVLYAEADKSIAGVLNVITDPQRSIEEVLDIMLRTAHLPDGPHPAVAGGARAMLNKSDRDRSGVVSTAESFLSLYRDPIVAANTAVSDFTIADLMCSERPVSLYLVIPPKDHERAKPLVRLVLNYIGQRLTEHKVRVEDASGVRRKRHRLLYLIDEFPTLGRLPFFERQLAYLRGYDVTCMLIAQSLNQLVEAYGQHNSLLDNCHVRVTYASNDPHTAQRIKDMLGTASLIREQISKGQSKGLFGRPSVNKSYQEYGRPLLTTDEIQTLAYSDALLMVGNLQPYRAKKVFVYDDPRFAPRLWSAETGANAAPESEPQQRRELPPRSALPHWLTFPPPPPVELVEPDSPEGPPAAPPAVGLLAARVAAAVEPDPSAAAHWEFIDDPDAMDPDAFGAPPP
jgi:type IV secretion system protein VirD4